MTLDTLDAAFVQRWRAAVPAARPAPPEPAPPEPARTSAPPPPRPPAPAALAPAPSASASPAAAVPPPTPARLPVRSAADRTLLDRLLAEAAPQWHAIADRIEAARSRGRRVIAVAGCDRGEGRTTLVTAVAEVLQSRGRDVVVIEAADLAGLAGPPHDKRIVTSTPASGSPRAPSAGRGSWSRAMAARRRSSCDGRAGPPPPRSRRPSKRSASNRSARS